MYVYIYTILAFDFIHIPQCYRHNHGKNNENSQHNESKFRQWPQRQQDKRKADTIFKDTYYALVMYLKILNQVIDGNNFPDKMKKESKETSINQ